MKQIKQVISIEKKYDSIISTAQRKNDDKLRKFESELLDKENSNKKEFLEGIKSRLNDEVTSAQKESEIQISNAKNDAEELFNSANYSETSEFVLDRIKNFGEDENV